jgi:hypothetical protein
MPAEKTVNVLRTEIKIVFALLDRWCECPPETLAIVPQDVGWSIKLIIEHISIVNRYLLMTLDKGVEKTARRAARGVPIPDGESDLNIFGEIADPDAFDWQPPRHMVPTGVLPVEEARSALARQRCDCLQLLERMENGEGFLHTVSMSVRDLGRLDLYQWLWFLLMHSRRHLAQMDRAVAECSSRVQGHDFINTVSSRPKGEI